MSYDDLDDEDDDELEEDPDEGLEENQKITRIEQDNDHRYQYCDGVLYRLSGNDQELSVSQVQPTSENEFYEDHIERYMDYIRDGGILDTFPVTTSCLAYDLEDMFEVLDDLLSEDEYGIEQDADFDIFKDDAFLSEHRYDFYEFFDEDDFPEYAGLNPKARSLDECFSEPPSDAAKEFLVHLKKIFDFFDEQKEYTLNDFNHRFEAVKRLGHKSVLVEVMD